MGSCAPRECLFVDLSRRQTDGRSVAAFPRRHPVSLAASPRHPCGSTCGGANIFWSLNLGLSDETIFSKYGSRLTAHKLHAALCSCPGGHTARVATLQHRCAVTRAARRAAEFCFHLKTSPPGSLQCSTRPAIFFFNHLLGHRCGRISPRMLLQRGEARPLPLHVRHNVPDALSLALSSAVNQFDSLFLHRWKILLLLLPPPRQACL